MNTKFTIKELLLIVGLSILLILPFYSYYLNLDLLGKMWFLFVEIFYFILIGFIIYFLVKDFRKNKQNIKNNQDIDTCLDFDYPKINLDDKVVFSQRLRMLKNDSFEYFVSSLFEYRGYTIEKGPNYLGDKPQVDGGKDLIISKNGKNIFVQIKKYFKKEVPVLDIQAFNGILGKNKGIFVTTSIFSKNSRIFAEKNSITCVDYECIYKIISGLSDEYKNKILEFINNEENIDKKLKVLPKTCKSCGAPMVRRYKLGGYGCLNYYDKNCRCREFIK